MADFVDCPGCQRRLRVPPDVIGQLVKCPGCGRTFRAGVEEPAEAPAAPPPLEIREHVTSAPAPAAPPSSPFTFETSAPPTDDDDFAERREEVGSADNWSKVRTGITMILVSYLIMIGAVILAVCAGVMMGASLSGSGGRSGGGGSVLVGIGLMLLLIVGVGLITFVLKIIGQAMCMYAPAQYGARSLAIASLSLNLLAIGLAVCGGAAGALEGQSSSAVQFQTAGNISSSPVRRASGPRVGQLAGSVGNFIQLIEMFVFLFFLRAVARCIRNHSMVVTIRQLLILAGTALVLALGTVVLMVGVGVSSSAGAGSDVMQGLGILGFGLICTAGVLMLVYFIWYLVALSQMRDALIRYVRTRNR